MENVIQEIVIKLEDGSTHIVYVTKLDWVDGKIGYIKELLLELILFSYLL